MTDATRDEAERLISIGLDGAIAALGNEQAAVAQDMLDVLVDVARNAKREADRRGAAAFVLKYQLELLKLGLEAQAKLAARPARGQTRGAVVPIEAQQANAAWADWKQGAGA